MDTKNRWPEIEEEVQALFLQQYEWAAEVRVGPELKPLPEPAVPQIAAFLTLGVLFRSGVHAGEGAGPGAGDATVSTPHYNVRIEVPQADPNDLRAIFLRPVEVVLKDLPAIPLPKPSPRLDDLGRSIVNFLVGRAFRL